MSTYRSLIAAVGGVFIAAWSAAGTAAEEPDRRFYVAPMASFGFFDEFNDGGDTLDIDNNVGGTLAIGKPIFDKLNLELYGFIFPGADSDFTHGMNSGKDDVDIRGYGGNLLFFPARDKIGIFGILGYATGEYDFDDGASDFGGSEDAQFLDFGAGYMKTFTDYGIAVRGEYRIRRAELDNDDFDSVDHVVSLGLQIPLGPRPGEPEPEPAPAPPPEPEPLDSDGDGVINENDDCAGTPPGTEVDDTGCPKQAAVTKDQPLVLPGTNFAFDSAELRPEAEAKLDELVTTMRDNPNLDLRIEGYTDSKGSDAYNMRLSRERARSVEQYLVDNGVDAGRLTAEGFGESDPVAPNTNPDGSDNPEGRAKNRRVEIHVAE